MSDPSQTIDCPACGAQNPLGHAFCGVCGARVGSTAHGDTLIGKVLAERFRIRRLLASGGMGSIYLAEHVGIGKRVAIKLLRADLRGHPHLAKRFRREAMAVSKLTDAHTITVFDFGVWEGLVYLVMEYLAGRDLSKVLEAEGRLTASHALIIAHQICSSLAEAHSVGVVHRDLKPENVFITKTTSGDELVKVLDFGLAKILNPTENAEAMVQTADGALMGTPYYMAPEQVRGEAVDARTDLYALGGLLFRMLTGEPPYVGKTPLQVMEGHVSGRLRTFREVDPDIDVPPEVETLVRTLLSRRAENRPQEALAVDQQILALLDGPTLDRAEGGRVRQGSVPIGSAPPAEAPPGRSDEKTSPSRPAAMADREGDAPDDGDDDAPEERPMRHPLAFDDDPSAPPRPLHGDPAARSWILGDGSGLSPDSTLDDRRPRRASAAGSVVAIVALLVFGGLVAFYLWLERDVPPPPRFEIEPNDVAAQATPMMPDRPMRGRIGRRGGGADVDVFVIEVPSDRRAARVCLRGVDGLDLRLEGFAYAGGRPLFTADDTEAGGDEAAQAVVDDDRLLVRVQGVGEAESERRRPYRLWARFAEDVAGLDAWGPDCRSPDGRGDDDEGGEGGEGGTGGAGGVGGEGGGG